MKQKSWIPRPGNGRINLFPVWQQMLWDLGGSFEKIEDVSDPKPKTGRRDPDRKPREYPLNDEKYGQDPRTGTIWRRQQ